MLHLLIEVDALEVHVFVQLEKNVFVLRFYFFFLSGFSFTTIHDSTPGKRGGLFFDSSPGDYCRQLTSALRQQPDSNGKPLVSERKSLTTKQFYFQKEFEPQLVHRLGQELSLCLRTNTKKIYNVGQNFLEHETLPVGLGRELGALENVKNSNLIKLLSFQIGQVPHGI